MLNDYPISNFFKGLLLYLPLTCCISKRFNKVSTTIIPTNGKSEILSAINFDVFEVWHVPISHNSKFAHIPQKNTRPLFIPRSSINDISIIFVNQ